MTGLAASDGRGAKRVVAICGGVGGAKLAAGLAAVLGGDLIVVVNTGDDFEHLGLAVSPDVDTVLYTLAGVSDRERGWGRAGETWGFMEALGEIGGETWFRLGDKDLALHVERTRRLRAGQSLSEAVEDFARRFGIRAAIRPMSDDPVRTIVDTAEGAMPFQRYFVERRAEPVLKSVRFEGAAAAAPSPHVAAALAPEGLRAVVICPSNPYLSVDPMLAVPGMCRLIEQAGAPVVAVSPIIGGRAVKGPTAKIMAELSVPQTCGAIADHYRGLIHGLVIDEADEQERDGLGVPARVTRALMRSDADRERLARETLSFADALSVGEAVSEGAVAS